MKKTILSILVVATLVVGSVSAQSQPVQRSQSGSTGTEQDSGKSSLSYRNVTIHKVLDHKDVYIVLYSKHGVGVGQVMIPKSWTKENPRKLQFRLLPKGLNPFMTVVYKDGDFHKVILTTPSPKIGTTWGVASAYTDIGDSAQAETLEIEY